MSTLKENIAPLILKTLEEIAQACDRSLDSSTYNLDKIIENLQIQKSKPSSNSKYLHTSKLNELFEDTFFRMMFRINEGDFYHYTSLETAFKVIDSSNLQMSSIAGMNDKSETDFVDKLLQNEFKEPYHSNRIQAFNRRFIMCFSGINDHFNQWRLYGNGAKGACLVFKYKKPTREVFYLTLGQVYYGTKITDAINRLYKKAQTKFQTKFIFSRLYLWKNFIKHEDYSYENEKRLLLFNKKAEDIALSMKAKKFKINSYGILIPYVEFGFDDDNIPIVLDKIILGPNCPEQKLNQAQLKYYLKYKNMATVEVELSNINHFR